mgnify:FL=1
MLNSDDIETAQLAANIIYREKGRGNLVKILGKSKKYSAVFNKDYVALIHSFEDYSKIFLKDPTRTTLIDLK